ncbi:MAG: hypothetical protein LBL91_06210 [Lachnospiraceae bacterium]|jgi:hypothetical protein|nr:hypothetical protein [Lachnospiraceae bacterium]
MAYIPKQIEIVENVVYLYGKPAKKMDEEKKRIASNISYKQILNIIFKVLTEEQAEKIFNNGGINMCPSEMLGTEMLDVEKEDEICNYDSVGCQKCWEIAVNEILKYDKEIENANITD